jgi:hypothetical protein
MIIFYIDESGTGLKDDRNPFFVLGCAALDSKEWQFFDSEMSSLKRRLISWAKPEDWEIKGRDLRRGEGFFVNQNWNERASAMHDIADLISEFRTQFFIVQVDKRLLPRSVESDTDLYRLAFWRLLEEINSFLAEKNQEGMLLCDMRSSSIHSSIQDRRLIDAYREWIGSRSGRSHLIELPWFGFSEFYNGLQLIDFACYLVDFTHNEREAGKRSQELWNAFNLIEGKIKLIKIP